MYGLTAALFAVVALAAPSSSPSRSTCTTKSTQASYFKVKDFDYHAGYTFSTPAHQNSWGYVNFTLANPVLSYVFQCTAASNQLSDFFYGNIAYQCTGPDGHQTPEGTFSFSRPTNELAINQTWPCPAEGSRFWAEAAPTKLNLRCRETLYTNGNWSMGQIYSDRRIICDKHSQHVPFTSMRAAA